MMWGRAGYRHGIEGKARHRDRGLYRRGTSPFALPPTLDLPAFDPMASLPWLILAWHDVGGEGGAGVGRSGCQVKVVHRKGPGIIGSIAAMYVYLHMHMHVCFYYMPMSVSVYICVHVKAYVCMFNTQCMCIYSCLGVFACICECICMYASP